MRKLFILIFVILQSLAHSQSNETMVRMNTWTTPFIVPYLVDQVIRVKTDSTIYALTHAVKVGQTMRMVIDSNWAKVIGRGGENFLGGVYVVKYEDVSSEYHPIMSIPAGWLLQNMIIRSTYGSFGAQLSCGTKSGADDIFQSVAINNIDPTYNPEGITVVPVERLFSLESQTSVNLNEVSDEDNWNGMECDVYLQMIKIK